MLGLVTRPLRPYEVAVFDWVFEGRPFVFVVCAALGVFLLLVWWQIRKFLFLLAVALVVAAIGLYALLDRVVETDREQLVRKVNELAAAVNARNVDALFENVSDNFRSARGEDKQRFRETVANYIQGGMVGNVRVWDIVCEGTPSRNHSPAHVVFSAKAESGRELLADCDTTFEYDAQHGWRLRSLRLLKPQTTEEWSIQP
jgi:hypothetical protein